MLILETASLCANARMHCRLLTCCFLIHRCRYVAHLNVWLLKSCIFTHLLGLVLYLSHAVFGIHIKKKMKKSGGESPTKLLAITV